MLTCCARAGLLRIADGGPSDLDVRWQLRKGSLPAMPKVSKHLQWVACAVLCS